MNARAGWIVLAGLVLAATPGLPGAPVGWRNDGTGRFAGASPPVEWSASRNIRWATEIGPNKYSSPIVVGGRIFLVADPALLFCVNADDGRILWKKSNDFADLPGSVQDPKRKLGDAGNTTPTPVSDGRFVYVVFGTGIVACYDLEGSRRWIRHFDLKPATEYGRAASPVLAGGKLLVLLSCLIALDPATGGELWRNKEVPELYGTPVAATIGDVEVVVTPSGQVVRLSDGVVLVSNLGGLNFASPVVHDCTVYMVQAGSAARKIIPGAGAWESQTVWEQEMEGTFYASALVDGDLLYAVSNLNLLYIVDAKDGKILASQDLTGPEAAGPAPNLYPSLALAGGRLYVLNDLGEAVVVEPGRQYRELKRNRLGAGHGGAPAFDGKHLYLRSGPTLYCIAEP